MEYARDSEIIEKVLAGDTNLFEKLVLKYQDKTYAFCYKILQDRDLAVESAHLAFVKAFEKLKSFRMEANFSTWLHRIAYNSCMDQIRHKTRFTGESGLDYKSDWNDTEINAGMVYLGNDERKKYLQIVLNDLDPEERNLVFCYYDEEQSLREISELTGLSEGNIKVRLYRARKKMYMKLERLLKDEVKSLLQ